MGLQFVVAMLCKPIMLRLLGQAEYGLYSLVGTTVSYPGLSFGFGGAYMRFHSRFHVVDDWGGVRRLNGLFLAVITGFGLIAAVGGPLLVLTVDAVLGIQFTLQELETERVFLVILLATSLALGAHSQAMCRELIRASTRIRGATLTRTNTVAPALPPWGETSRCQVGLSAQVKAAEARSLVAP